MPSQSPDGLTVITGGSFGVSSSPSSKFRQLTIRYFILSEGKKSTGTGASIPVFSTVLFCFFMLQPVTAYEIGRAHV